MWSPDGLTIAFRRYYYDTGHDIYSMAADGSNLINLTSHPATDITPKWSSDGTRIAFNKERDDQYDVHVIDADGSNEIRLTTDPANDWCPEWRPTSP